MALVLVKEDGTGKPDANSYALVADGDAYHDGHLYASGWTAATTGNKEKALVMAARLIDAQFQFNGFKRVTSQALQWPRRLCPNPDNMDGVIAGLLLLRGPYLDETKVQSVVVNAACEMARELLKADRTDDPDGEGLVSLRIEGALKLDFDAKDRQPPVTRLVQTMLGTWNDVSDLAMFTAIHRPDWKMWQVVRPVLVEHVGFVSTFDPEGRPQTLEVNHAA